MGLQEWKISKGQLEEWMEILGAQEEEAEDKGYTFSKNHIFTVVEQIYDILQQMENHQPAPKHSIENDLNPGLSFSQIHVGKEYQFNQEKTLKPAFHGKKCKVIEKKRKNVIVVLLEPARKHEVGTKLSVSPIHLQEI